MEDTKPKIPERIVPLLAALRDAQPESSTDVVKGRKQSKTGSSSVEINLDDDRVVMCASIVKTLDGGSLFALYGNLAQGVLTELDLESQFQAFQAALTQPDGSFSYELASIRSGSSDEVQFEECSISAQGSGEDHTVRITVRVSVSFSAFENLIWVQELESFVGAVDVGSKQTVRSVFLAKVRALETVVFLDDESEDPLGVDDSPEADEASADSVQPTPAVSSPKPTISAELQRMINAIDLSSEMIPAGDLLDEALALQRAGVPIMKHPADGDPFEVTVDGALGKVRKKLGKLPTVTRSRSRLDEIRSKGKGRRKKKGDE